MSEQQFNRDINLMSFPLQEDTSKYVADEPLIQAVEIALALGKPLIISGEPGTGKTRLADWVAQQLATQTAGKEYSFLSVPFVFNTKSVSSANDLFYYYDAISHFQDKEGKLPRENFIELYAMGMAIAQSHGKESSVLEGISGLKDHEKLDTLPRSSVVLVDEIDKAPRDFPNDLLNEMDKFQFRIKELNQEITMNKKASVLVILTSNSEKNLPNAFLRRCVFYHIPFPDKEKLVKIAAARIGGMKEEVFQNACEMFMDYRKKAMNKKPATSEFLDWIRVLKHFDLITAPGLGRNGNRQDIMKFQSSLSVLMKSKEDLEKIGSDLK